MCVAVILREAVFINEIFSGCDRYIAEIVDKNIAEEEFNGNHSVLLPVHSERVWYTGKEMTNIKIKML